LAQEAGEKDFKDLSIFKRPEGLDPSLVLASGPPEISQAKTGGPEKPGKPGEPEGIRPQALDPKDLEMRMEGPASGRESSPKMPGEEKANPPPSKKASASNDAKDASASKEAPASGDAQESKPPVSPPPIEPPQFTRRLQLDDAT